MYTISLIGYEWYAQDCWERRDAIFLRILTTHEINGQLSAPLVSTYCDLLTIIEFNGRHAMQWSCLSSFHCEGDVNVLCVRSIDIPMYALCYNLLLISLDFE